ncbi:TPA: hypothetical protein LOL70_004914 [Salmonella enterica subsp. enterica serovar Infantis]|nr:hypothetical protein [Salmonella enterica subsp. enterica serovar Infantis]
MCEISILLRFTKCHKKIVASGEKSIEIYRVALRGDGFQIKNNVLTVQADGCPWSAPILCGDTFKIQSKGWEISGKVSHVITGNDGSVKNICLIFDGNIRFEGDLSEAEFLIPE